MSEFHSFLPEDPDVCPVMWPRLFLLVDMNAFFASVEQRDFPHLRGKPVAVTNGERGTCVITSSYEARAKGVKTGMRLPEARALCPDLIQRASRPHVYAAVSAEIMDALYLLCPDIEIFSVDEAFIDATHCQRLLGSPGRIAQLAKQAVLEASGLLCSVGVSGDKTTAKYAAKLNKPDGLTVIPPWEAKARLAPVPVTEISGIAGGIGKFLAERGVEVCGDMEKLPIGVLARRFGNLGKRIWYMCQGEDPEPLIRTVAAPKSIGHGKVMPPNTRSGRTILTYLQHMCFKISVRLRRHDMDASEFWVGLKAHGEWLGGKARLATPDHDAKIIFRVCRTMVAQHWKGQPISQIQVTALDPQPAMQQLELFSERDNADYQKREKLASVQDAVNERYGEFALAPLRLLDRSDMPNVIAPAWKPSGHRQSV